MNKMVMERVEITLPLPRAVNDDVAGDIEKESVFVSPHLERILVGEDRLTARLIVRRPDHAEEVCDKARRYLEVMSKRISGFETKLFLENVRRDDAPYAEDVNGELVRRGWLHDYGSGQVAYSGPVLKLARLIDAKAGELYARAFAAEDAHFPALVEAEVLHKAGYFDSHPNAVTFVGNMIEDFDAIEEFRLANSCSEGALLPRQDHVHIDGMCLNPAACFPAYPTLRGRRIASPGYAVSWLGRVFRYESRNISGLDRLYEFNVRELVLVGSENYVRDARTRALPLIGELAGFFDLDLRVQTATDPFFATVSAAKKFWQQAQEVKNEILIPVGTNANGTPRLLACGSVNLHGNFFGARFDIADADGEPAQTGCIGLGIERWVLAAFTQHGFDPARWPAPVRDVIFA